MGRCDQGIKFCSKIQSAQNRFKPERERRPHHCEPNATRFISNGRQERKILQSIRQVKQAKKMMLTVQSVQSVQADVAGPYDRTEVTWQVFVG
jgi:hypothetical protein